MRLFKITDLKWITILVIVCMMFSWHAMAKDVLTVRVGDYPPAYYKNSIGEWVGIEIDVLKAVFKEAQIQYQFLEMPWSPAVERIKTGELDVMLAISLTEERKSFIDYIGPSRYEQMVLIVRKDDMDLNVATLDDLAKLPINVGIQTDTEYPRLSERLKADPAFKSHFDYVTDQNFNLKRLSAKRIAGFFEDRNFALHAIRTRPEYGEFAVHKFALSEPRPVYITVSLKLDEGTRAKLKNAYKRLEQQGELKKIWKKWE